MDNDTIKRVIEQRASLQEGKEVEVFINAVCSSLGIYKDDLEIKQQIIDANCERIQKLECILKKAEDLMSCGMYSPKTHAEIQEVLSEYAQREVGS